MSAGDLGDKPINRPGGPGRHGPTLPPRPALSHHRGTRPRVIHGDVIRVSALKQAAQSCRDGGGGVASPPPRSPAGKAPWEAALIFVTSRCAHLSCKSRVAKPRSTGGERPASRRPPGWEQRGRCGGAGCVTGPAGRVGRESKGVCWTGHGHVPRDPVVPARPQAPVTCCHGGHRKVAASCSNDRPVGMLQN